MTSPKSKTAQLEAACEAKTQHRIELKKKFNSLIDDLARNPGDDNIGAELTALEAQLAQATASINALEEAIERSREADAEAARLAALAATEDDRQLVLKLARQRGKVAAEVDAAAQSFLDALQRWRAAGEPIVEPAVRVAWARTPKRSQMEVIPMISPHARGADSGAGYALLEVVIRAVETINPDHQEAYLTFGSTRHITATFSKASADSLEVLEQRTR